MELTAEIPIKNLKQNANLHVAECIRQFELPQQFPSTVTELNLSNVESKSKLSPILTRTQNRTSSLPLPKTLKFSNKKISFAENPQKVRLKLINGKNLEKMNIVAPNNKEIEAIKLSNQGLKSEKPFTWAIKSSIPEKNKPKVKTITKIIDGCISKKYKMYYQTSLPKMEIQILNSCNTSAQNAQSIHLNLPNLIKPQVSKQFDYKKDFTQSKTDLTKIKHTNHKLQAINIDSYSVSEDLLIMNKTNQVLESSIDKSLPIDGLAPNSIGSENSTIETKIILKQFTANSLLKKRNSSFLKNLNSIDHNEPILTSDSVNLLNQQNNYQAINEQCKKLLSKNMVIVPNESPIISNVGSSNIMINKKKSEPQDLFDNFSILKKAVLSVQDNHLRVKALAALKDCGIKTKKRIPLKRSLNTKVINESQTQTEIFCLLKEGEFIKVTPTTHDLSRIKQRCLIMKQPLNSLSTNNKSTDCISTKNTEKFKQELDNILEKKFSDISSITCLKQVFYEDKMSKIRTIWHQLRRDFEKSEHYDNNGLLEFHRVIINNSIHEVQKHIIILKAIGKNIDIATLDKKTGLELAVEYGADGKIIKLLLDSGAQPVSSKPIHDSAIIIAAKKSSSVLPLLFEYVNEKNQSLLNAKNSEGFAAIHYCAQRGNLGGITELLKFRVQVNLQDERCGKTALFYAVDTKNCDVPQDTYYDIAFKLLEYGAASNIPTFSKHSALSIIDDIKNHSLKIALNKAIQ